MFCYFETKYADVGITEVLESSAGKKAEEW